MQRTAKVVEMITMQLFLELYRVLARIKFKRPIKHVRLGEIFLVTCRKQAFSFNKREAKVYCYAFLHVLKSDAFIKHEEKNIFF
jgi:hypothetical protein